MIKYIIILVNIMYHYYFLLLDFTQRKLNIDIISSKPAPAANI